LLLLPISKNKDPTKIRAAPKNAALSVGKKPNLSPKVKTTIATPMITIIQLLIDAVEYRANSFFPVSVTR